VLLCYTSFTPPAVSKDTLSSCKFGESQVGLQSRRAPLDMQTLVGHAPSSSGTLDPFQGSLVSQGHERRVAFFRDPLISKSLNTAIWRRPSLSANPSVLLTLLGARAWNLAHRSVL